MLCVTIQQYNPIWKMYSFHTNDGMGDFTANAKYKIDNIAGSFAILNTFAVVFISSVFCLLYYLIWLCFACCETNVRHISFHQNVFEVNWIQSAFNDGNVCNNTHVNPRVPTNGINAQFWWMHDDQKLLFNIFVSIHLSNDFIIFYSIMKLCAKRCVYSSNLFCWLLCIILLMLLLFELFSIDVIDESHQQ